MKILLTGILLAAMLCGCGSGESPAAITACSSAAKTVAATVSVVQSGASSYVIQGNGLDGVTGIQLDIVYDASSLSSTKVTQGGLVAGAMLVTNTSLPGLIKIAIVSTRAFSGSGPIATITFESKTGNGGITSITTSMIDSKGAVVGSSTSNSPGETAGPEIITTTSIPFFPGARTYIDANGQVQPCP